MAGANAQLLRHLEDTRAVLRKRRRLWDENCDGLDERDSFELDNRPWPWNAISRRVVPANRQGGGLSLWVHVAKGELVFREAPVFPAVGPLRLRASGDTPGGWALAAAVNTFLLVCPGLRRAAAEAHLTPAATIDAAHVALDGKPELRGCVGAEELAGWACVWQRRSLLVGGRRALCPVLAAARPTCLEPDLIACVDDNGAVSAFAARDIAPGEDLSFSFLSPDLLAGEVEERQAGLLSLGFRCPCPRCADAGEPQTRTNDVAGSLVATEEVQPHARPMAEDAEDQTLPAQAHVSTTARGTTGGWIQSLGPRPLRASACHWRGGTSRVSSSKSAGRSCLASRRLRPLGGCHRCRLTPFATPL